MRQSVVMMALSTLLCGVAWGQAKNAEPELPLAAKSAVQELERTIQLAKKKAVEKLKSAMRAEMQSGNLVRANLINQQILRITEQQDSFATGGSGDVVAGEWRRKDGVAYVFNPNGSVSLQIGWSGKWEVDGKTVVLELTDVNGKAAETKLKYTYEGPTRKVENGHEVWAMTCPGSDELTLYKK